MKTKIIQIAKALELGTIDYDKAKELLLELLNDSNVRTFNVGDTVKWRGMDLIVVEVGVNEVLIANTQDINNKYYNDWWVATKFISK